MNKLIYVSLFALMASCSGNKLNESKSNDKDSVNQSSSVNSTGIELNDSTLLVREDAVIFLWPDSLEMKKMETENSEEDYATIVDDMSWYPSVAAPVLDSLKIKKIDCDKACIILRKSNNKEIKLRRKEISGNMIVFNNKKDPMISYASDFDKDSILNFLDK